MSAKSTEKEATNKKAAVSDKEQEQAVQAVEEKPIEAAEEKTTGQKTQKTTKATGKKEQKTVEKPAKKQVPKKQSAAKKTEKPEPKTEVYIEYQENQILESDIIARVVENVKKEHHKRESSIKSLRVYIKPEESKAYYVANDDPKKLSGNIDL